MGTEKICFVLMGYGEKTDYVNGRKLNLDKTFEHLIQPVFEELNITCIRASDILHSGNIDVPMYEYILKADIVVADLSTLNANAIYELGVRHGVRPYTTIVIAEDQLKYPFDLNHISISPYQHLGVDIGASEAIRFRKHLKQLVTSVMTNTAVDSPLYTFLKDLKPPEFTTEEKRQILEAAENAHSVSDLIKEAEASKSEGNYKKALEIFNRVQRIVPNELFIVQRRALLTYKLGEPSPIGALMSAAEILNEANPESTNDVETLGLLGAIYKRLHERTDEIMFLHKSIEYYERGFLNGKDYYNGVNLAFLLLLRSTLLKSSDERIADKVNAKRVRDKTFDICSRLYRSPIFGEMPDRVWILLTMAEIVSVDKLSGISNSYHQELFEEEAKQQEASAFELSSYNEQQEKINRLFISVNAQK